MNSDPLQALDNWRSFFSSHEKYRLVGHVINPPIDPNSPIPPDCRKQDTGEDEKVHAAADKAHARPGPVKATGS